jgi:hypothetical protein
MSNPNRADISVFENIQADQHDKTGMSQMTVFNDSQAVCNSKNTDDMLRRVKMMHQHVKHRADLNTHIKKLERDKATRKNPDFYEGLIKDYNGMIQTLNEYLRTEAKNITILGKQECERLNFVFKLGERTQKEGVDPALYKERWRVNDILNGFYRGTMPNGEPYTKYLD